MKATTLLSPAKLNLCLLITGRRADGYHNLQTAFQFIDLCDDMQFQLRSDSQINCHSTLATLNNDDNLIVKAAKLLQKQAPNCGVDISLNKRIPMGAGLGGGSSNAATTLLALNQLWQINLSKPELMELGVTLGADVSIFIHGHAAWGEGIGEQLQDINLPEQQFLVVKPPVNINTAKIFTHPQLTRDSKPIRIHDFLSEGGRNDCQPLVEMLYPEVAQAQQWLSDLGDVRLTGTGSCVFCPINDKNDSVTQVVNKLPDDYQAFIVKGLNKSPLFDAHL